jgi:hypothetical protein
LESRFSVPIQDDGDESFLNISREFHFDDSLYDASLFLSFSEFDSIGGSYWLDCSWFRSYRGSDLMILELWIHLFVVLAL